MDFDRPTQEEIKTAENILFRERFWSKVNKNGPTPEHVSHLGNCWIWEGAHFENGYGWFWLHNQRMLAHRISLEQTLGHPIKNCALHKCDTRLCVRPSHLWDGTKTENAADRQAKGRHKPSFGAAKLTWNDVGRIRALFATNSSLSEIADTFEISKATGSRLVNHKL